jgi:iron complex transport system substrate-binding protein
MTGTTERTWTRRGVGATALAGLAAARVAGPRPGRATAQQATPDAASAVAIPDLELGLTPGVVPTAFGDVEVPADPRRVVAIKDGSLDFCLAVGLAPVGITRSANGLSAAAYLLDRVDPGIPYVGGWGELDLEAIVALDPDLILGEDTDLEGDAAVLRDRYPCVAIERQEDPDPAALQFWERQHLLWGHATGRDEQARQTITALRQRAAGLRPELGAAVGQSVVVFRPQAGYPVVMSQRWITGVTLAWAGLAGNPLTEGLRPPHSGSTVSLEQIDELDADWLFLAVRDAEQQAALEQVWQANPLYQGLRAVQSGQVAVVDGALWSGAAGVLAAGAMIDDIERILVRGDLAAPPA